MLKIRILVPVDLEIPESPEEWQLYTTEKGVGAAARDLVRASVRALRSIRHDVGDSWSSAVDRAINTHLAPVLRQHAELGASDPEPLRALRSAVERGLRQAGRADTW